MLGGISIPNGITWTEDHKTLYVSDSPTRNIYAFDYDLATGGIIQPARLLPRRRPGRPARRPGPRRVRPSVVRRLRHRQGRSWPLARRGGGRAAWRCRSRCVTCPVFVDGWLYVTSAAEEEPGRFPESRRYQGAVFRCEVGVRGADVRPFLDGVRGSGAAD